MRKENVNLGIWMSAVSIIMIIGSFFLDKRQPWGGAFFFLIGIIILIIGLVSLIVGLLQKPSKKKP